MLATGKIAVMQLGGGHFAGEQVEHSPGFDRAELRGVAGGGDPSVAGIALGDPVIAAFLEFFLQSRECDPIGLISLAVDLHRAVVRRGERVLRFLAGAPQRSRQFITVTAAIPVRFQRRASFRSRGC
jgi:hypothetical protein